MLRFLGTLTIVGLAFACGIYIGRQGPETLLHQAKQLSSQVLASTSTLERNLSLRTDLVNAKERLVQAKSELLDKNYGRAATGLGEARQALKKAMEAAGEETKEKLEEAMDKAEAGEDDGRALKPGLQAQGGEIVKDVGHPLPAREGQAPWPAPLY